MLPPFKAAVDAGVATVMNSFNEIAGIPATGDAHLQRDILKGEWGFQGMVVSDWGSIGEMVSHGFGADRKQAAQQAIAGRQRHGHGVARVRRASGRSACARGRRPETARRLGRGESCASSSGSACSTIPTGTRTRSARSRHLAGPEHLTAAREVARESIVLLKNDAGLLPLDKGRVRSP